MNYSHIVVLITVPSREFSEEISHALVKDQLAACVNIIPGIFSIYQWKGGIESDNEFLLIAKSRTALLDKIVATVKKFHPYDVPEVIALPIIAGSDDYMAWIDESTSENEA